MLFCKEGYGNELPNHEKLLVFQHLMRVIWVKEFLRFVISDNDLQREFPLLHSLSQVFVLILDTTDMAENLHL